MQGSEALGILASVIHLASYALYNRQVIAGRSRPNTATWILWTFLAGLNASSYLVLSEDWAKAATPVAGAAACAVTLAIAAFKGKLSRLDRFEWLVLLIGAAAGVIWWLSRNAGYANLLLQFAFVLSNVPTFRGVWRDPSSERPLPWFGFGLAYVLNLATVILRWRGEWMELAYPVLSLVADGGVGVLIALRRARPPKATRI